MQFTSLLAILASSVLAADSVEVVAKAAGLTSLLDAIAKVGLTETVLGLKNVTIFAPTNQAFADVTAFAAKNNLTITDDLLKTILTLHILPAVVPASAILSAHAPITATALSKTNITAIAKDGAVLVSGPGNSVPAKVVNADVAVSQGVVHVIDTVLLPDLSNVPASTPTPKPILNSAISGSVAYASIAASICVIFAL